MDLKILKDACELYIIYTLYMYIYIYIYIHIHIHIHIIHIIHTYIHIYVASDRIMKKESNLDRSSPVYVFSIIRVFPVRVQNFPDVI